MRISFGGTNTHLANLDCKSIIGPDGTTLSGDMAARILDIAGLVCNRNTIPGDKSANNSSGIRFGTPWATQRGLKESDMIQVADIMADIIKATIPYSVETKQGLQTKPRLILMFLKMQNKVRELAGKAGQICPLESQATPISITWMIQLHPKTVGQLWTWLAKGSNLRSLCFHQRSRFSKDRTIHSCQFQANKKTLRVFSP